MIIDKPLEEDLELLQQQNGSTCISIIVPVHRLSPERRTDRLEVKRTFEKARLQIAHKFTPEEAAPFLNTLDELYNGIDFNHNPEGLGFYVSGNTQLVVPFPFPVQEKVIVGDNFLLRDLIYKHCYAQPYYVLFVTEKINRLFEGKWERLTELKDDHFPMEYIDEYAYSSPERSSSYAGHAHVKMFERDKSDMQKIRITAFFRKMDKILNKYITNDTPLILVGVDSKLTLFYDVSRHTKNIIAKIGGNHNYDNPKQLSLLAWDTMKIHFENEAEFALKEFEDKIGKQRGVSGIEHVWTATQEGRGLKLLVEKDFSVPAYVAADKTHLYLNAPRMPHKGIPDAVDEIIQAVLEKKGSVYFFDNGGLDNYRHIALITRY
ncbi:MAG TPA: hypothetical protein VGD17_10435 [Chitinophagaceae bacterium]